MAKIAHTLMGVTRTSNGKVGMPVFGSEADAVAARDYLQRRHVEAGQPCPDIDLLRGIVSSGAAASGLATRFTVIDGVDPLATFLHDVASLYARPGTSN